MFNLARVNGGTNSEQPIKFHLTKRVKKECSNHEAQEYIQARQRGYRDTVEGEKETFEHLIRRLKKFNRARRVNGGSNC